MAKDMIDPLVTLFVGLFAFIVYKLKKRSEKRNAATIIVMDIRHAEQVVNALLEKGVVDRSLKDILLENNWTKYKHLFASDFSQDDFSAFNRFFVSCVEISDARRRMLEVFYSNLNAKASFAQQKLLEIDALKVPDGLVKRQQIIEAINFEDYVFEPNEPKQRILNNLEFMGRLSNTIAFEKLKKITGNTH